MKTDLCGDGRMVLTTEHPQSSYGIPVLLLDGTVYGPGDMVPGFAQEIDHLHPEDQTQAGTAQTAGRLCWLLAASDMRLVPADVDACRRFCAADPSLPPV